LNNRAEQLKNLPAVDEILRRDELADLCPAHPRVHVVQWTRDAIADCRRQILGGEDLDDEAMTAAIVDHVRQRSREENRRSLRRVINATGVLLHTNLGRAPLADRAIERMRQASGYTNVELDLTTGKRSHRGHRATRLMAELAGAEDAVIVNNCAGATILVLQAVAQGREVIVSRGQLVEIGGGFRLPDVFESAGVRLREVGTTNRTYLRDYENAVSEQTGAIIRVHRSNFLQSGFVTEPSIDELVAANRPAGIPVIDDLGSGCFCDLSPLGLHEPTVRASVACGADLTLFSGDKLFGGPQCGIVVGRSDWIAKLRRSPIMRAVRVDKLTIAGMEATAEIHLAGNAINELPLLNRMFQDAEAIRGECDKLVHQLPVLPGIDIEIVPCQSQIGGGAVPGASLPSYAVKVSGCSLDALQAILRGQPTAVQARVVQNALMFDLRTVLADDFAHLASLLRSALESLSVSP
jgi:L-seryl-tRNA(Ser) seleniumtransferase